LHHHARELDDLRDRMLERVRQGEPAEEIDAEARRRRAVQRDRHVQAFRLLVERPEVGMAERLAHAELGAVRSQHRSHHAELDQVAIRVQHAALEFHGPPPFRTGGQQLNAEFSRGRADRMDPRTMTRGLLLTMTEPPAAMDEEFNAWYDAEHIPERLSIPGFRSARRWVADCKPGEGKYLATYELDAPGVLSSPE